MASRILKALQQVGTHAVGNLNSLKVKTVANGALIEGADVDNFTLVELGFNTDGERVAKQLSAVDKKAYLVAAPETRYLGEAMADFYNAVGERARIVILEEGYTRFDTSAFTGAPTNGKVAHFDPTSKKFLIHDGTHADYATAKAKFLVVSNEDDMEYTIGQALVRLEVIEA
ncbi:hypothetical protein AF332_11265 [Sporosarcina globispora]|uniref:Uncharacterized protein n=1 Tax=Sporosarcina globispora TaxID=1459 RepID=A0A0M0GC50_SPOGL|nr:hypothetical protein [Sporosarcina globispora]KON87348.1 hypothetical protein AF332_11265 [Sporosarcina globispora]